MFLLHLKRLNNYNFIEDKLFIHTISIFVLNIYLIEIKFDSARDKH